MKLLVFCADGERSFDLIKLAAEKHSLSVISVLYKKLSFQAGVFTYDGEKFEVGENDRIILRWPWESKEIDKYDYNIFVKYILERHGDKVVLDKKVLSEHSPFYEDKLYQALCFRDLSVPAPKTYYFSVLDDAVLLPNFPLIVKKRIASRGRQNFVVNSETELEKSFRDRQVGDYIFQELISEFEDVRVYFYKGEIIGGSRREITKEENRLRVSVTGKYEFKNKSMVEDMKKVSKYLGADLVGFDFLVTHDKYYLIEANLSPQFAAMHRETGINVADVVISDLFADEMW